MSKLYQYLIIVILIAFSACKEQEKLIKTGNKPNIILIYADDLGRGMLGTYGQKYLTTPNIDKLASEGMRFNNVYGCMFCAPARASLISGMHDAQQQQWSLTKGGIYIKPANEINLKEISEKIHKVSKPAKEGEVFLGTVAQKAGYVTAEIGKLEWGFATTPERVKSHGWDYHYGFYDHKRCHGFYPPFLFENGNLVEIPGNTHIDCAVTFESESEENYKARWNMDGKKVYSEDLFVEKALSFIESNNPKKTNKPFFIYYPTQLPHGPIAVSKVDAELKNNPNLTEFEKEYATMVKILDNSVGQIYKKLEELDILDNTIIIFTGDNGHEIYTRQKGKTEHGRATLTGGKFNDISTKFYSEVNGDIFDGNDGMAGLKRSNWEGGVRVPLFWYWKGKIKAGSVSNELVANYDLLNTISEITNGKTVLGKDSKSYLNTLFGGEKSVHDYTVYASKFGPAIVTKNGWKLRSLLRENIFQLYYLPDDYREENVLNEQNPEKVEELKKILLEKCDADFKNGGMPKFVNPEKIN
ncbi:sulfatase-like hydrolase/transferase [Lutibacter citreus]|uniref:sulfatase-like hydrolase/transferase n=1 Tax=Lutibacter citreus TaxID=2138210 RepID=UPI000DBE4911|nr:sulfatase-like hydrolase/transferase [Lutibacter citreus]